MGSHLHIVDPFNKGAKTETVDLREGAYLGEHLMERWPEGIEGSFKLFHGSVSEQTEIQNEELFTEIVHNNQVYYIIVLPGFGPEYAIYYAIAAVVLAVAAILLIPDPRLPDSGDDPNKSTTISQQTNEVREGERVLEAFGLIKVFPDLIGNSIKYWDKDEVLSQGPKDGTGYQTVEEYLCVSIGYVDVVETLIGDTAIENLQDSSVDYYNPGERPPTLIDFRSASEVSDVKLLPDPEGGGEENSQLISEGEFTLPSQLTIPWTEGNQVFQFISVGDQFDVVSSSFNSGTYTLVEYETVTPPGELPSHYILTVAETFSLGGTATDFYITEQGGGTPTERVVGPFSPPGAAQEIWLDFYAPRGICEKYNRPHSVVIRITVEILDEKNGDPTGESHVFSEVFTGDTYDERRWTRTIDISRWFSTSEDQYVQVTCVNLTQEIDDSQAAQELRWSGLSSYREVSDDFTGFEDVTTAHVRLVGNELASSISNRRTNTLLYRKLPGWGTVEDFHPDTPRQNSTGLDAVYYLMTSKYGARIDPEDIDTDSFLAMEEDLAEGVERNFFNAIFSNKRSADEDIVAAMTSLRGFVYRDGQSVTVVHDNADKQPMALFNRRNKSQQGDKKTFGFDLSNAYDGIEATYIDAEEDYLEITKFVPEDDGGVRNYKTVELVGITDETLADERISYEYNKLRYQWDTLQISVTDEGWILRPNQLIYNVDNIISDQNDGNLVALEQAPAFPAEYALATVSNPLPGVDGSTGALLLRDPTANSVKEVSYRKESEYQLTILSDPGIELVGSRDSNGNEVGSLYWVTEDGNQSSQEYLVSEVTPGDPYTTVQLTRYHPEIYSGDLPSGVSIQTIGTRFGRRWKQNDT